MKKPLETKFDECGTCRHFVSRKCKACTNGEFFELEVDEEDPTDDELMNLYRDMSRED